MRKPVRTDGYAPIECYAALGDGRTVALVAGDGRVDWWPVPTVDAPPAFAALLDPAHGGHLSLGPVEDYQVDREYLGDSNVLATTFRTASGQVRVVDALTTGLGGRLPWTELARRVEGRTGRVRMHWAVVPGDRFGAARPWAQRREGAVLLHVADQHLALRCFDVGTPQVAAHRVSGEFVTEPGGSGLLAVVATDDQPMFLPDRDHIEARLARTEQDGQLWSERLRYEGPWSHAVYRSALALRLLFYRPSGAIAAAPTTSLPETLGGDRNWDYRYCWVRDTSFTLDALIALGLHEEVHASVTWLLRTLQQSAPDIRVFYKLDGRVPEEEARLDVPGYRGSRPVRSGNGAAGQRQLGTFGDLFETVWLYVQHGHVIDQRTSALLATLADRCCDEWIRPDSGIWELDELRHYTLSKIACWVALDRAVRLVDAGQLHVGRVDRWRAERDDIHRWVDEHCWSAAKGAYTFYAGSDELDAAVLLAGRTGFDRGERLAGTVRAVRAELARGPLLYRYSGMVGREGAFVACSFWLVEALVHLGQLTEARRVMDAAVDRRNDVGLLSEQIDPRTGVFLGNFPQGLSHLALVNAATAFSRASGSRSPE